MKRALIISGLLAMTIGAMADHAPDSALPPLETVLKSAIEKAKQESVNDRLFNQRYQYTRTRVTEYRNGDGELTKTEKKSNDHRVPVALANTGRRQSALVLAPKMQDDGKPKKKDEINRDALINEDLFSRFQFTLVGREQIAGRTALIVDFKPANKKLPVRDFKDRFINLTAGRLWVDEVDYALVKASLHLTEKVNVIGGLVGAVAKFNCTLGRERTVDGLWFTHVFDWHLEGRAVMARRTIDYHEEKLAVQKGAGR
jgi:hypothetical protein